MSLKQSFILICLVSLLQGQTATQPTGSGTSESPYKIGSVETLYWISQNSSSWDACFEQTADITFPSSINTWDSNQGWTPIGNSTTEFLGIYEGKGYTISGLYINRPSTGNVGLFGLLGYDGDSVIVRNLHLDDVEVYGGRGTGSLVGRVTGDRYTLIAICSAINGTVVGDGATGGLVGSNNSWKTKANAATFQPVISMCYSHIDVIWSRNPASSPGADKFGGLVGCNQKGKTLNSYALGSVTIDNDPQVGSLIPERIGGLAGCTIYQGVIEDSYSATEVTIEREIAEEVIRTGGLLGLLDDPATSDRYNGTVNTSFWDTQTSKQSSSAGGTGKTTSEMQTASTFTDAGWDFSTTWTIVGTNYPQLDRNPDSSLPVVLSAFSAEGLKGQVILSWTTEVEIDNLGFRLERTAVDGSAWSLVADYQNSDALLGNGSTTQRQQYTYTDRDILAGETYTYRLSEVDYGKHACTLGTVTVRVPNSDLIQPTDHRLLEAFPNPFNPGLTLHYVVPETAQTTLTVHDLSGAVVATLLDANQEAGQHTISWEPQQLAAGVYLVQMVTGDVRITQKVILLK